MEQRLDFLRLFLKIDLCVHVLIDSQPIQIDFFRLQEDMMASISSFRDRTPTYAFCMVATRAMWLFKWVKIK